MTGAELQAFADALPVPAMVMDGRRVLGIHVQQGAIVDRFALVAEGEAK